jgi:hypothetical protein
MKADQKVAYEFVKAMHITLRTKGVQEDPVYFYYCLKEAFGRNPVCKEVDGDFCAFFIEELAGTSAKFHRGEHVSWMEIPMQMLNPTIEDRKVLKSADYVVQRLTGRSRQSWVDEYLLREKERTDKEMDVIRLRRGFSA